MNIADDLVKAFNEGYEQGKADAVVHGNWEVNNICSVCGDYNEFQTNFCPNCGAYMRGESDG